MLFFQKRNKEAEKIAREHQRPAWVRLPLVLFFSGYYLGFRLGGFGALVGGLGFVLGIALVLVYDRKVARKANIDYTITAFARKI